MKSTELSEAKADVKARNEAFEKIMKSQDKISRDNTVICVFPEAENVPFFGILAGMGVSICQSRSYLANNELKSRYLISSPDEETNYIDDYEIVYRDDDCVIWQKNNNII